MLADQFLTGQYGSTSMSSAWDLPKASNKCSETYPKAAAGSGGALCFFARLPFPFEDSIVNSAGNDWPSTNNTPGQLGVSISVE